MKWLIAALMVLSTVNSFAGNELGNGGDSFAQEFVAIGRTIVERLKAQPDPNFSPELLSEAVENTAVITKDRLELRGVEVDAINFPVSNRIEINRARWKEYGAREKISLVLHEYLGIAGVDDARYEISGRYVEIQYPAIASPGESSISDWPTLGKFNRFSLGLYSGTLSTSGNIGKLYRTKGPSFGLRISYVHSRQLAFRVASGLSRFEYSSKMVGGVDVSMISVGLGAEWHFLGNPQLEKGLGFDPYLHAGADQVFRANSYSTWGFKYHDNALAIAAGLGMNYFFIPRKVSFGLEGKAAKIHFKDRFESTYLAEGVADTTGWFYGMSGGMNLFF